MTTTQVQALRFEFSGPLGVEDAISLGEQLRAVPDSLPITVDLRKAKPTTPWAVAALVPALASLHRELIRARQAWVYTLAARAA